MMKHCADAAAAKMVGAMVDDNEKMEDELLNHFNKPVENLNEKLNKKMTDWEVRMQAHWDAMEKRWMRS